MDEVILENQNHLRIIKQKQYDILKHEENYKKALLLVNENKKLYNEELSTLQKTNEIQLRHINDLQKEKNIKGDKSYRVIK